jgi:uncharacterized protein (DUF302 family)
MEVLVTVRRCSGVDGAYLILDICNPKSAKRALERDRPSMLLPCNVVVRSDDGRTLCRHWQRPPGGQAQDAVAASAKGESASPDL